MITSLELTQLIMEISLAISCLYFSLLFFLRINHSKKSGIELAPFLAMAIFGLCIGIMFIFFAYYDFYKYEYSEDILFFYKSAVLAGFCGLIGLIMFSEKVLHKTKYVVTIISSICCVYAIFFVNTVQNLRIFTYITMPIMGLYTALCFLIILVLKTKGDIRKKMIGAFACELGWFFFYILHTDFGTTLLPFPAEFTRIFAHSALAVLLVIWVAIFLSFETFTEFGWRNKMKELYIFKVDGSPIFQYSFVSETTSKKQGFITSTLTGIKDIIAEMVQSKRSLKVIDHQDVKILLEYGKYSIAALIVYDNLKIFHSKLRLLMTRFEYLFQDVLTRGGGEIGEFLPIQQLFIDVFLKKKLFS